MSEPPQDSRNAEINALITAAKTDKKAYAKLVEALTDRVWSLWREEMRLGQIRRGGSSRR
ncbi:MAG: hypothetical protein RLP44_08230 [Aggregatilineales bacterium]